MAKECVALAERLSVPSAHTFMKVLAISYDDGAMPKGFLSSGNVQYLGRLLNAAENNMALFSDISERSDGVEPGLLVDLVGRIG